MLPHLFRIGRGKDHGRRPAVAQLHSARRVLPERAAADVDRLVHAAPAALVPCSDGDGNAGAGAGAGMEDRKSTRLNSSHLGISYAVFCLKKKTEYINHLSICTNSAAIQTT